VRRRPPARVGRRLLARAVLRDGAVSGPGGHGGSSRPCAQACGSGIVRMGHPRVRRPQGCRAGPAARGRCFRCGTEPGVDFAVRLRAVRRRLHTVRPLGCGRSREGPRRGTKPMEGQGVPRPAMVGGRPNSTAEQRLEVDVVVSRSSRACASNGARLRVERGRCERHGGNGHGDVVRLLARIPSGGVKCAARTMSVLPPRSGLPGRRPGIRLPETQRTP
jgi:hypothetical protein